MKIRHKITFWVAGAGLLTSLVFSLVVFVEMREQPLEILDSELDSAAAALAGRLAAAPGPPEEGRLTPLLRTGEDYWIKVYSQNLRPVYHSPLATAVDLPLYRGRGEGGYTVRTHIPKDGPRLHQDEEGEVTFRVRAIEAKIDNAPVLIQIAKPMENLEEELSGLLTALGVGLAVSTVLLVFLSYVFAGRIVRPVAVINRLTREINENTLEKRIPLGKSRDEIYDLSASLNRMFDRLQYSFARQKQFLANASHELKSPLAILRLFFDESVYSCPDLSESFRQQLIAQHRTVLRMDRLVKTLLELSVLELNDTLRLEEFSLTDLSKSVLDDFSPIVAASKIRLETDLPEKLSMWGDRDKVRRMLINILDNAVKYNIENGEIKLQIVEKEGLVRLSLFNTGPGIPPEERERVFDQFHRVEKSRSLQYGGAGLGLAIVKEIVRLHGGQVSIDSAPGAWTRINIVLPQNQG